MLAVLLFLPDALAVPVTTSHQGRLLDATGVPVQGAHLLRVRLFDAVENGTELWSEETTVEFDNGYFAVTLGASVPLESEVFAGDTVYAVHAVDGGPDLEPRLKLGSVPFAHRAHVAWSVEGGVVDASELRIDGVTRLDADGYQGDIAWNSIADVPDHVLAADTLAELDCGDNQIPAYNAQVEAWLCADDASETLTDDEVRVIVEAEPLNLAPGSTLSWDDLIDVPVDLLDGDDVTPDWSSILGIPTTFEDGLVSWSELEDVPTALADGAVSWSEIDSVPAALVDGSVAWTELANVPTDLADGSVAWGEVGDMPAALGDGVIGWSEVEDVPEILDDGAVGWGEITGVPTDLLDGEVDWAEVGDLPSQLADGIVGFGELDALPAALADGDVSWDELTDLPSDLSDGAVAWSEIDSVPTVLSDGVIAWSELTALPSDLADGTIKWSEIDDVPAILSDEAISWSELAAVPSAISDGAIAWNEVVAIPTDLTDGKIAWTELTGVSGTLVDGAVAWGEVTGKPTILDDGAIAFSELTSVPSDVTFGALIRNQDDVVQSASFDISGTGHLGDDLTVDGQFSGRATWGPSARTQGLIIIPEGPVTDNGDGTLTLESTVIVMNPAAGSWIRVLAGSYTLGSWGYLYVDLPPSNTRGTNVGPTIGSWADADRLYDNADRVVLAQRAGSGRIYTNFAVPPAAESPRRLVTVHGPNLGDYRNNSSTSAAGTWWTVPNRTMTFTKRYSDSILKITYQDTLGTLGPYYAGCHWRILLDGSDIGNFSAADQDRSSGNWNMEHAEHVAWYTSSMAVGTHTVSVQNMGNRGAWGGYTTNTQECLMGWNTTANFISVEEIP